MGNRFQAREPWLRSHRRVEWDAGAADEDLHRRAPVACVEGSFYLPQRGACRLRVACEVGRFVYGEPRRSKVRRENVSAR